MSIPCRCSHCEARYSLSNARYRSLGKKILELTRKCKRCGGRKWRIDRYRLRHELGIKPSCDCGGYWFRHRAKSKWCIHNPNWPGDVEVRS